MARTVAAVRKVNERPVALTLSGGLQVDYLRQYVQRNAATQGDGATVPAGFGVWPAATNLVTNGGFETNTTGWAAFTTETIARSTAWAAFGQASLLISPYVGNQYNAGFNVTLPAAGTYVISVTIKVSSDFNKTSVQQSFLNFANETARGSPTTVTAGNTVRTSRTITVSGAGAGDCLLFVNGTAGSEAGSIAIDGVQVETGAVATPYIETDGGTAARAAGRVQMPVAGLFTATQGWMAIRKRVGAIASGTYYDFTYRDADNNERLNIAQQAGTPNWQMIRITGGAGNNANSATAAQSVGQETTLVGRWTATATGISVAGAAFSTAVNSNIPTLAASSFDIGSFAGGSQGDGNYYWVATGSGTLTDADAVVLNAFGNTPPTWTQLATLGAAAVPTALWTAVDGYFTIPATRSVATTRSLATTRSVAT